MVILDQTQLPMLRVEQRCTSVAMLIAAMRVLATVGAPAQQRGGCDGRGTVCRADGRCCCGLSALGALGRCAACRGAPDGCQSCGGCAARVGSGWRCLGESGAGAPASDGCCQTVSCRRGVVLLATGAHGAGLFGAGARICTICNAGALATASRTSRRWVWCGDCGRMVRSRLSGCRRRDHCCRVRV